MTIKVVRSPRAPAVDLADSLKKAQSLLKVQGKQLVPGDVAAKHLGYSGKNNGAAARTMAALKAFGLVDSNAKGDIAVSKDVEAYQFSPDLALKQQLLTKWLMSPKVFADLLAKSDGMLPSDEMLRYHLIEMGFTPDAAADCTKNFKSSVTFARYFENKSDTQDVNEASDESEAATDAGKQPPASTGRGAATAMAAEGVDRIPVRLSKGRRAWLELPSPFYEADKDLLKRQIDLIFADEEEDPFA